MFTLGSADEFCEELEGKAVTKLYIKQGEQSLAFKLTDGSFLVVSVVGGCCSESWWADMTGLESFGPREVVQEVESIGVPEGYDVNDGRSRQIEDAVYGFKVKTTRGYAELVFRNSSNGYYAGWIGSVKQAESIGEAYRPISLQGEWHWSP